jgi:hypothetical protein
MAFKNCKNYLEDIFQMSTTVILPQEQGYWQLNDDKIVLAAVYEVGDSFAVFEANEGVGTEQITTCSGSVTF